MQFSWYPSYAGGARGAFPPTPPPDPYAASFRHCSAHDRHACAQRWHSWSPQLSHARAPLAQIRTRLAELLDVLGLPAYEGAAQPAQIGTVPAAPRRISHPSPQVMIVAAVTLLSARDEGIQGILEILVRLNCRGNLLLELWT